MKNKLSQKASGSQSEETVLMKAFKYFDLNNNGTVEPEEFAKAIEKIGIMIPTKQVSILPYSTVLFLRSSNLRELAHGALSKDTNLILFYRIWTLYSVYTTKIEVEP